MSAYKKLFREAGRLKPTGELWRRIEAGSGLSPAAAPGPREPAGRILPFFTPLRAAAVIALAAGVAALFYDRMRRPEPAPSAAVAAAPAAPAAGSEAAEAVDPEVLAWQTGLGEIDWEADEGFPYTGGDAFGEDAIFGEDAMIANEGESL